MTGISEHTLRAWERRYTLVMPERTEGGQRLYSLADIERLKLMRVAVDQGMAIRTVAHLSVEDLKKLLQGKVSSASDLKHSVAHLGSELADGKVTIEKIGDKLDQLISEIGIRDGVMEVFIPLLAALGRGVASGEIGIAREHAISALFKGYFGYLERSARGVTVKKKTRLLLATAEDDLHEFGILAAAILLRANGFWIRNLGPNLPAKELIAAVSKDNIDLVILGCSEVPGEERKVSSRSYLNRLDESLPSRVKIWLGGRGSPTMDSKSERNIRQFSGFADFEDAIKQLK